MYIKLYMCTLVQFSLKFYDLLLIRLVAYLHVHVYTCICLGFDSPIKYSIYMYYTNMSVIYMFLNER